jgi:hypothetical protein
MTARIYVRDEEEKEYLKGKYPDVDAQWLKMPPQFKKTATGPIVCINSEDKLDMCPQGEDEIEKLVE